MSNPKPQSFRSWNPLEEAYNNSQFNNYCEGPGAGLEVAVHSTQGPNQQEKKQYPYLFFRNVPSNLTKKALYNICTRHGRVRAVRDSFKNPYFFVDFETISDLEAVYRALEKNDYGFIVTIGREKPTNQYPTESKQAIQNDTKPTFEDSNTVDMQGRLIRPSGKAYARPEFKNTPLVSKDDYSKPDSLLQKNDPKRHYLIEDDAHALERANLEGASTYEDKNVKYVYRTGRAYMEMPEETKKFFEEKCKKSDGQFSSSEGVYKNTSNFKDNVQFKASKCSFCGSTCDFVCPRCQTFYCGMECQKKDWQIHRRLCLQRALTAKNIHSVPLERLEEHKNKTKLSVSDSFPLVSPPRSGSLVALTSISATNLVFIRSKSNEDNTLYFKVVSEMQTIGKNLNKLFAVPKCGNVVAVQSNGQYVRAMVLNADDLNAVKLIHMDYGNVERELLDNIYDLPQNLQKFPRLVVPVLLKGVPRCYMTNAVRELMYSYLNNVDLIIKYKPEDLLSQTGAYTVELFSSANHQFLNKMLIKLCTPVDPGDGKVCLHNYLPQQYLPTGEHIDLVIMDNSNIKTGVITCTKKEYALEVQKFVPDLQNYAESLPEQCYAPRIDELCIVKSGSDHKWYRGRCLELVGDGNPSIMLIDYGHITVVNIRDIRRYPPQFAFPIFAHDCEIKGLREYMDDQLETHLKQLLSIGDTVHCDEIEESKADSMYILHLQKLITDLKADGLLKERQTLID